MDGLGYFPFRSPLLRESQHGLHRVKLLSIPRGTEMVHFSRLPLTSYFIQMQVTEHFLCPVARFGDLRI
jgi:hypothetical protein